MYVVITGSGEQQPQQGAPLNPPPLPPHVIQNIVQMAQNATRNMPGGPGGQAHQCKYRVNECYE